MTELEALVSLNMVPEIGSSRLERLLHCFSKPENIFKAAEGKLAGVEGIGWKIAAKIHSSSAGCLQEEFSLAKEYNLKIITCNDPQYPENLKHIPGYPIVLYVKGEIKPQDNLAIAIVGSRQASLYGISTAREFAGDLSESGFTIVSGMARGIDTAAHKGALKRGGRTIAVIGSGFKHLYPEENSELAEDIARHGAVISEFPISTEPLKQNFPRRNRVISGLSQGVLVVEAARNSGALITADFALEQGREVFALPGKIDSATSFGTNALIKQGAKLVSSLEDILEEFNLDTAIREKKAPAVALTRPKQEEGIAISQEGIVYRLINQHPLVLDEIAAATNLSVPLLSNVLLKLQMRRLIMQLPGQQYIRSEYGI